MASKESERVGAYRRNNFDRVTILAEKGGRELYRVLALREGISMTEMIRRAVLARAGLNMLPWPDTLAKLKEVKTQEEARRAVRRLQNHEESDEILKHLLDELGTEPPTAEYTTVMDHADIAEFREAVQRINAAIEAEGPEDSVFAKPVTVKLSGREIGIMRRLLSNIEAQDIEESSEV